MDGIDTLLKSYKSVFDQEKACLTLMEGWGKAESDVTGTVAKVQECFTMVFDAQLNGELAAVRFGSRG